MPKDESSHLRSKSKSRWPWIARLQEEQEALSLKNRRWVGRIKKKMRICAAPSVNREARKLIHLLGYRYVINDERLPGTPHLVFPARKLVIFTVSEAPGLFRGSPPDPRSRSDKERGAWELLAAQRALSERGWRCELITSDQARRKKELRRRVKEIFHEKDR